MMRAVRMALAVPLVAAGIGVGSGMAHQGPGAVRCAEAAWEHHVALVVEHGDGRSVRVCIGFDGPSITGLQILQASTLEVGTSGFGSLGAAICQIDNEPAAYPPSCWTSSSPFWVLFVSRGGGPWSTSAVGASSVTLADGDAAGFRYDSQTGPDPEPVSPAGTCVFTAPSATARAATTANTASTAASTSAATPTGTVAAVSTPGTAGPPVRDRTVAAATPAVSPGLVAGAAATGALIGLLAMQLVRRRQR